MAAVRALASRASLSAIDGLPIFANVVSLNGMSTMNISLPEPMRAFVDERVNQKGYGSSSEYVRDLIRRDQEREALRALLLEGAQSPAAAAEMTPAFFAGLRAQVRKRK